MAYRLERNERVDEGLWRIFCEELQRASAWLSAETAGARDQAIHETRRSLKKVRSILRLIRAGLGARYRRDNARLSAEALKLSPLRDAAAVIEAFDALHRKYRGDVQAEEFRAVRAGLVRRKKEIESSGDAGAVLRGVAKNMAKPGRPWRLGMSGSDAIESGLAASWRRGRKALARVRKDAQPENFHALRKRVKDYRLQISLLNRGDRQFRDLDRWLGEDHNLWLLANAIGEERARYGRASGVVRILNVIAKRRADLQKKSVALACEVYKRKRVRPKSVNG
jgi:hypothetical protein